MTMKYTIKHRHTGEAIFAADIDATDATPKPLRLRMAVIAACAAGANLADADLTGADLTRAYLADANLAGANLTGAYLRDAYLTGANLAGANLTRATLAGADLTGANLAGANLAGVDLTGVGLIGVCGVNGFIKALHLEEWPVSYTATVMQIGCERHPIEDWRSFDDARIVKMDGKRALDFWRKNKALIFQAIDTCPARPTGGESA